MQWEHSSERSIPVRTHEYARSRDPRRGEALRTTSQQRCRRLLVLPVAPLEEVDTSTRSASTSDDDTDCGNGSCEVITESDLEQALRDIQKIQRLRKRTVHNQRYEAVELLTEGISKRMKQGIRRLVKGPTSPTRASSSSRSPNRRGRRPSLGRQLSVSSVSTV